MVKPLRFRVPVIADRFVAADRNSAEHWILGHLLGLILVEALPPPPLNYNVQLEYSEH